MTENRGGLRSGAGRKPDKDKKQTVSLYFRPSEIIAAGGLDKLKQFIYKTVEDKKQKNTTKKAEKHKS